MKRLLAQILIGSTLLAPALAMAAPKLPTLSDPTKSNIEDQADTAVDNSAIMEANFPTRQQRVIKAVDAALNRVEIVEKRIDSNTNFTDEQKSALEEITANFTEALTDYKKEATAAKDTEELYAATKNAVKTANSNREQMRASTATVVMIGVEQTIKKADAFFVKAEVVSKTVQACGANTSQVDATITEGKKDLTDLEKSYDILSADSTIQPEERPELKKAGLLAAQVTAAVAKSGAVLTKLSRTACSSSAETDGDTDDTEK